MRSKSIIFPFFILFLLGDDVRAIFSIEKMSVSIRASGGSFAKSSVRRGLAFIRARQMSKTRGDSWHACSGTIISDRHILTAAHCVVSKTGRIKQVMICVNTKFERQCNWKYSAESCVIPSSFLKHNSPLRNDIAVCRLSSTIKGGNVAKMLLMSISKERLFSHNRVFFSGAGPIDQRNCKSFYDNRYFNTLQVYILKYGFIRNSIKLSTAKVIRASAEKQRLSQCGAESGDSGGPLYVLISGIPHLFGVVTAYETVGFRRKKMTLFSNAYSRRNDIRWIVEKSIVPEKWGTVRFEQGWTDPHFDSPWKQYFGILF